MSIELKKLVAKGWFVHFEYYRQGVFYYSACDSTPPHVSYIFPVPVEDVGEATLLNCDKSILFMRWIRKAIADNTLVMQKEDGPPDQIFF